MKNMKSILLSVLVLALLAASRSTAFQDLVSRLGRNTASAPVYDATAARDAAIDYPKYQDLFYPIRVYDATAAMLEAVTPKKVTPGQQVWPVYDATGAMLEAITPKKAAASQQIWPVYDATGAMLAAIVNP